MKRLLLLAGMFVLFAVAAHSQVTGCGGMTASATPCIDLREGAAPANPPAGTQRIFGKATGNVFSCILSDGTSCAASFSSGTFDGMTLGSIFFAGTGGLLSQDNANLFWNDTTNRLFGGPRTGFTTNAQGYVDALASMIGALKNSTSNNSAAITAVLEDSSALISTALTAHGEDTHTSGTKTRIGGVNADVRNAVATGATTTLAAAVTGWVEHTGAGTTTSMASLYAFTNTRSAGTVGSNYGLFIENQTAATNNWAIKTGTGKVQFGDAVVADKSFTSAFTTVTFSATPTFDASLGNSFKITLTANVTSSTLSNPVAGQHITFIIVQDATGGRTFAWPSNVVNGVVIDGVASATTTQEFIYDGTNAVAVSRGIEDGYALQFGSTSLNPADATTYYIGDLFETAPDSNALWRQIPIPRSGTVKRIDIKFVNLGTLSTSETSTVNFRLNNTTDTVISSVVTTDANPTKYALTNASIQVAAGDFFEIKWVTPTWVTDPTSLRIRGVVYVE